MLVVVESADVIKSNGFHGSSLVVLRDVLNHAIPYVNIKCA